MTTKWVVFALCVLASGPVSAQQVAHRSADDGIGDRSLLDQPARLLVAGVSLRDALRQLRERSGVPVVFSSAFLPQAPLVRCSCEAATVRAALDSLLVDTDLHYFETRTLIVIEPLIDAGERAGIGIPAARLAANSFKEAAVTRRLPLNLLIPTMLWVAPLVGQQPQAVTGSVVDSKTGRPIVEATISVENSAIRGRSNARGEFRLEGATGTVRLAISRVGYRPATASATAGTPVRIELEEQVVKLDELVVTGTAAEQTKRSLGNVVGQVNVADLVQLAPPVKLQDMLSVNVPGVRIFRASGAIGSGGPTRIRGSGSLSLSNEPLIYVDGVRTNNDPAVENAARQGFYDRSSRINDLNPEEIESIEVLKGPSAATIYGTEASNGVIQIITKRGKAGRPVIDVHADAGANWFMNPEGRYPSNYYIGRDAQIHEFNVQAFRKTACADPALNCYTNLFRTGKPFAAGTSLSGGNDQVRYYFSLDAARDEGYFSYNWQNKYNGRANISYTTTNDKFKADLSLGMVRSRTRVADAFQAQTSSISWACRFPSCEPSLADPDHTGWNDTRHGFQRYYPEAYDHAFGYQNVDRTILSLRLSHRPFPWLRQQLTVGPDFTNDRSSNLIERDATGNLPFFDASFGYKAGAQIRSTFLTLDYGAAADWNVSKDLISTTSAGAQYYYKSFDQLRAEGRRFAIPGESDITGAAQRTAIESYLENKNVGVYVQEQLAYKNRFFLTGAVRGDDNSAFGSNFNAVIYPKLSFSWVLSEEPFMADSKILSQLKFRAAWGRAGLAPDVFSAIRTYAAEVGALGIGGVSPQNIGNPDLKPEVGQETEVGFDAGLFDQKLGLEFTFYNKDVKDAIISVPNKPSRGFPGVTFLNLGKTRNRGIELAVDGTPFSGDKVSLDLRGTIATNSTEILDMGALPPLFSGASYVSQWNVQGFAPGSFFYRRVIRSTIEKRAVGTVQLPVGVNPICEGGTNLGYGDGTEVPCAAAPLIYSGRPTPSWNGSLSATLTFGKRLRILGLVDYLGGHTVSVGDVGAMHMFFLNSRQVLDGSDDVLSGYLGTMLLLGDANAPGAVGLFKGGFAKLRTIAASYDLPTSVARWVGASRGSITLSGENLVTLWRAQSKGYGVEWVDSEISSNNAGNIGGSNSGYIQESFPQAARIRTTIRFTF